MIVLPRLATGIARLRNGVPSPELVARLGIERRNPAARAGITRAVLNDHPTVGDKRSSEEPLLSPELVLRRYRFVPDDLPGIAVDGNHATIGQVGEEPIFPERDAAGP